MNAKLEKYFEEQKSLDLQARNQMLLNLNLDEKEYSPTNTFSEEYHYFETDENGENTKYYKLVPIKVTDEEYRSILKYENGNKNQQNRIAKALSVIAWIIYIGGFIAGLVFGMVNQGVYYAASEFSFAIMFVYWSFAFISGTAFLALSEIIKLLGGIKALISKT